MRMCAPLVVFFISLQVVSGRADDPLKLLRSAVQRSQLDQKGTHPFHLKASLAPSQPRDNDSNRTGGVEIWWSAPGVYRREVRSPGFHQIQIVSGGHEWQQNEGDYLPQWLDQLADALLHPLPEQAAAMKGTPPDKMNSLAGSTYLHWEKPLPMDMQPPKQSVAITDKNGLLFYDGGLGWGAEFKEYADFHGRAVPRTISDGDPEVTAKVVLLEDLPRVDAGWFDAPATSKSQDLGFVAVERTDLAKDVMGVVPPLVWPTVTNAPWEGVIWTDLVLDRAGTIREPFFTISDNPAINDFVHAYLSQLHFKPPLKDGVPMQAVRHVVMRFALKRPPGIEGLGTAKDAFERGRRASDLSTGSNGPYVLKGRFTVNLGSEKIDGTYTDTWADASHWKREAVVAESRAVRSCDGEQQYLLLEGARGKAAQLILTLIEPIPAGDTMTESDWRVDRDTLHDEQALRVLRGRVEPGQPVDPKLATVYWFDQFGLLVQTYTSKLTVTYDGYKSFQGSAYPRIILARPTVGGGVALRVDFEDATVLQPATLPKNAFRIPGHDWKRQFTGEVR